MEEPVLFSLSHEAEFRSRRRAYVLESLEGAESVSQMLRRQASWRKPISSSSHGDELHLANFGGLRYFRWTIYTPFFCNDGPYQSLKVYDVVKRKQNFHFSRWVVSYLHLDRSHRTVKWKSRFCFLYLIIDLLWRFNYCYDGGLIYPSKFYKALKRTDSISNQDWGLNFLQTWPFGQPLRRSETDKIGRFRQNEQSHVGYIRVCRFRQVWDTMPVFFQTL